MNRAEKRRQRKKAEKAAKNVKPGQQTPTLQKTLELAVQHHEAGDLHEAEGFYQQVIQVDPNQPVALNMLGLIANQLGKNDVAVEFFTKALAIQPGLAEGHVNLGIALHGMGKLDEAINSYHKALAIKSDYVVAHNNLGIAYSELGRPDEAMANYHKALALNPDYAEGHINLGNTLRGQGKLDEAIASYHKALAIKPDYADAHGNLGLALNELGKVEEAFTCQRRALAINPENDLFWAGLAESLETLSFTSVDDKLWQDLLHLLERPTVQSPKVIRSIVSILHHHPNFAKIIKVMDSGGFAIGISYAEASVQLSAIPLFLRIIGLNPIYDLKVERMLTTLRCAMIQEMIEENLDERTLPFSAALALQCFTNEYVFSETEEEKASVEQLHQQISVLVEKERAVPPSIVVTLATYRPLYSFPWAQELCKREWPDNIREVIERQITEPLEEQSLRPLIPRLTSIQDGVSQFVREQYEENPYPRWIKFGIEDKCKAIGAVLQGAPLHLDLGDYQSPENPEILVAGCGTGQHALNTASRFSKARVLAVDLSLNSLSYALRKTRELNVLNIEYAQADIMELGSLGRQFDLIESVGVLHHLGDPLPGWRVLVDLLRPQGLMKIGLYSETARQNIICGRSLIAEKGYTSSLEDIRRCRQDIITKADRGNLEMAKISGSKDFFSISECRDLLFHIQEHRFTLPQVEAALQVLNLKFLGFEMRDQRVLRNFRKSHPSRNALTSLALWHKFELMNPFTFGGMYQFWCKKM